MLGAGLIIENARAAEAAKFDLVGSPETIADEIERWFTGRTADGFNLHLSGPRQFALFRERVVPILRRRGLFRTEYTLDTLRGHLGLPVPENRWSRRAATWRATASA